MTRSRTKARRLTLIGPVLWLLGLAIVIALVAHQGFAEVASAVAVAGWGVVGLGLVQLAPMTADTLAWRALLRPRRSASFARLFWARWIGQSVNNLLPAARVGGDVLRAWLVSRKAAVPGATAGASVIVDVTATIAAQVVFTVIGLFMLFARDADPDLIEATTIGASLLFAMLASFFVAQRLGIVGSIEKLTTALMRRFGWTADFYGSAGLQAGIEEIYRRRGSLLVCVLWHLAAWIVGTLEVWVALWLLDHPVTLLDALIVESLIQAVRSAAFLMPGALGAQEGGLILLGGLIGVGPEVALALALLLRLRELLVGLPGLLAWQLDTLHGQFVPATRPADR